MTREEAILWLVSITEHEGEEIQICDEDAKALQIGIDAIKALEQTDKIEESNFSSEQYKADLQCAYDCGYNCGYAEAMNDIAESEDQE